MTRIIRAALVLSLAGAAGCAGIDGILRQGIVQPEVKVLSAAPTSVDFEGVTIAVDLSVRNPNAIGLRLSGLAWQLDVEGGRVASGDAPGGLTLPANGAATSRVQARVRFADLAALVRLGDAREKVDFRVQGRASVETPIGPLQVPWSFAGDLPVPNLPRVELGGLRPGRQTFTDVEVILRLRVQNPNDFPLPQATLRVDVDLAGERVAQATSEQLAPIAARGAGTIELPVRVSVLGAGRALLGARGKAIPVAVRGTAGFGWMQHPFAVSGELPLP